MTFKYLPGSPRRKAAQRFGRRLRRAIDEAGVSVRGIAIQTRIGRTALHWYLAGESMPRYETASLLAKALNCRDLALIASEEREQACARETCTNTFVNEGSRKFYCSARCRKLAEKGRDRDGRYTLANMATEFERHREAVAGMCWACEPSGQCVTPSCPLRGVSPLRLVSDDLVEVVPMPGPYGTPENVAATRRGQEEASKRRWARPGEREKQSERTRRFWAELSPEERDGIAARIREQTAKKRRLTARTS